MKKINSKQTRQGVLSPLQTAASIILVAMWVLAVSILYFAGLNIYLVFVVMILMAGIIGTIFFVIIIDNTRFDRLVVYCKFRIRVLKGDATINTLVLPLNKLRKHIPIKNAHENGLIQFIKNEYRVLFRYDPPTVPESESETFHNQVERIVNSFGQDTTVSFHFYNMIDHSNRLKDQLLSAMNDESKTLQQKQHLHGMYEDSIQNSDDRGSIGFLMAISLGEFKSIKHAEKAYKSTVPGILKILREQNIYSMQVVCVNEVAIELRKFAVMEGF